MLLPTLERAPDARAMVRRSGTRDDPFSDPLHAGRLNREISSSSIRGWTAHPGDKREVQAAKTIETSPRPAENIILSVHTGLRRGSLIHPRWDYVDFLNRVVRTAHRGLTVGVSRQTFAPRHVRFLDLNDEKVYRRGGVQRCLVVLTPILGVSALGIDVPPNGFGFQITHRRDELGPHSCE
jgi:hypothetical protein